MRRLLLAFGVVGFAAQAVFAASYGFSRITSNSSSDVAAQLSVDVTDLGDGKVQFRFFNTAGIASSITDVYFDGHQVLDEFKTITGSAGVSFSAGASPSNLPGGNALNPDFDSDLAADSNSPTSQNGVDAASEWVNMVVKLEHDQSFADLLQALNSGDVRIGLHVQAIGTDGESDSFVNNVVPAPAAFMLGALGMALVAGKRRLPA